MNDQELLESLASVLRQDFPAGSWSVDGSLIRADFLTEKETQDTVDWITGKAFHRLEVKNLPDDAAIIKVKIPPFSHEQYPKTMRIYHSDRSTRRWVSFGDERFIEGFVAAVSRTERPTGEQLMDDQQRWKEDEAAAKL